MSFTVFYKLFKRCMINHVETNHFKCNLTKGQVCRSYPPQGGGTSCGPVALLLHSPQATAIDNQNYLDKQKISAADLP